MQEPESIEEARERLREAKNKKRAIEYQLSSRIRDGSAQYLRWRRDALHALCYNEQEMSELRDWLRRQPPVP